MGDRIWDLSGGHARDVRVALGFQPRRLAQPLLPFLTPGRREVPHRPLCTANRRGDGRRQETRTGTPARPAAPRRPPTPHPPPFPLVVLIGPSAPQVNFLKEFCAFSQTLQPQNRDAFFKTLSNMGILPALEVILVSGGYTFHWGCCYHPE